MKVEIVKTIKSITYNFAYWGKCLPDMKYYDDAITNIKSINIVAEDFMEIKRWIQQYDQEISISLEENSQKWQNESCSYLKLFKWVQRIKQLQKEITIEKIAHTHSIFI